MKRPSLLRLHRQEKGQKQPPEEAESTQSRKEEEGWLLKIEVVDSAMKLLVEPIQQPEVEMFHLTPSTEPVGVQETSKKKRRNKPTGSPN